MEIWIDNNLTRIVGEYEFFDELQYQINCFIESDEKSHRYYSAHTAIAVLMYRYGDDIIATEPSQGEYALDLLMIAKYFERIGDHCTNIAEWVEFSVTGIHKDCQ